MMVKIRRNRYDNWYGYRGGKRVIAFGNSPEFRAGDHAMVWLLARVRMGDAVSSESAWWEPSEAVKEAAREVTC